MTPEELAAIKDRAEWAPGVAPDSPLAPVLDAYRAWLAGRMGPPPLEIAVLDNLWLWYDDAAKDRQALLDALSEVEAVYQAEVARLRKQIEDEPVERD